MPQASSLYTTISIDNLGQEIAFRYYTYIYEERSASSATYIVDRYPLIEECCGEGRETGPSRCSHTNTHTHTHIYIYKPRSRSHQSRTSLRGFAESSGVSRSGNKRPALLCARRRRRRRRLIARINMCMCVCV